MWKGLEASDKLFADKAVALHFSADQFRNDLKRRYRMALEAIKAANAGRDRGVDSEGSGRQDRGQPSPEKIQ
jgi:hypothetical protein